MLKFGGGNIKIHNDKYYTPVDLAEYVLNKTKEIIGDDNITEYLEPSAGNGVFLNFLDKPYIAYDIEPEDERVIKQDFLSLGLNYKPGRCVIGNPPYGRGNSLSMAFYKKSVKISDYIIFILPISQLNNNIQLYDFNLLYSEDLNEKIYSNIKLHCCLNIYKRPKNGELNHKPNNKLKDIELKEYRRSSSKDIDFKNFDIGICSYGSGIIGKIPIRVGQYVKETYIKVLNENLKEQIIEVMKNTNWEELCKGISGQVNLSMWIIYKYLKENIPQIS